jgi:Ulp1 family protease
MSLLVENTANRTLGMDSVKEFKDVVKNATRGTDIFSCDKMYIPTNINNCHWTMTVVNFPEREIHYYDSLSGDGKKYTNILIKWLACELMFRKSEELDIKQWKIISKEPHVPQQTGNGTECGVFYMMCADFTLDNLPLVYSLGDMKFFRNKIAADILRNAVNYSFLE